jgi:hypothetical protein
MFIVNAVVLWLTVAYLSAPSSTWAQDPTMDIVKKMKEVFEPVRPSTRRVTLIVNSEGETVQFVASQARKQFPDGKRMVMVLLQPTDLKGNNYLVWEPDKPSSIWAWIPFLRRLRQFPIADAYEHYLGATSPTRT